MSAGLRTQQIDRLRTYMDRAAHPDFQLLDFFQVAAQLDRVKELFAALCANHTAVVEATAEAADKNALITEFYAFEDDYLNAIAGMNARFVALTPQTVPHDPNLDARVHPVGPDDHRPIFELRMPIQYHNVPDTWGLFNGDRLSWSEWRDKFRVAVHDNAEITPVQKFTLLKKALIGEPSEMVARWNISDANYIEAWNRLEEKYDKKYPLACAHLGKFFALPRLKNKATAAQLQQMSNTTHEMIRHLRSLEYQTDGWDIILVQAIQHRLDTHYRGLWEKIRNENEKPTWKDIVDFWIKRQMPHRIR